MTPKERFIAALERKSPSGRVPHFELVFFLTMEAFGKVHPSQRRYSQWDQMSDSERRLHLEDIADLYIATADTYDHDAIFIHCVEGMDQEGDMTRLIDVIREKSGDQYFIMTHGDATYALPGGDKLCEFIYRLADEPEVVKADAERNVDAALEKAAIFARHGGLDGFALCSDYCFNDNPFLSPAHFGEFITPYLKKLTAGYRKMGFYVIKHTDGNIMPILDQLIECGPHALHSLDPQGGVDIAEVKKLVGDKVCLIGNVSCSMLDSGTDDEVVASARYALENGMPNGGYIFSTSNCVYTGMRLERYNLMLDTWREFGNY
ncbi:MAG: hypothetical protein GXP32_08610 [Kiritimatiellaeota bacterium]|nr:hypothetical protein [Kiritimatiellota bacterium]